MKNILIVGATSAIAEKCAQLWAVEKAHFFLVGRNADKLQQVAADLQARGAQATTYTVEMNQFAEHPVMLSACYQALGKIDIALIAHGTLSDQAACEKNVQLTLEEFSTNCLSIIALLTLLANKMEEQQHGTLAVISSVAGDRGRASNYIYGSAKACLSTFCAGLRARLFKANVNVLTIKPGFVATPMTQNLALPQALVASPEKVAQDIVKAVKRNKEVLYTPGFWLLIMTIIESIPEFIFKRLKI